MNWPAWWKWTVTITLGMMTFCITFASSVFSTATMVTAVEFNVSTEVMTLGTSLFVLVSYLLATIPTQPSNFVNGELKHHQDGYAYNMCIFTSGQMLQLPMWTAFLLLVYHTNMQQGICLRTYSLGAT